MASISKLISLLVVVETPTLGDVIGSIFEKTSSVAISGVAFNGPDALDMVIRLNPDVVLLDLEMPQMDGMTLLQNLMIKQPTPTIIMPSLNRQDLNHSFEALKNGAVDFIGKESLYENLGMRSFEKEIVDKLISASRLNVRSLDSLSKSKVDKSQAAEKKTDLVFCEDCGARNIFETCLDNKSEVRRCAQCGDLLETHLINQHKKARYVTVIAAGSCSYANLVKIIPRVPPGLSGAIIILIYDKGAHVDAFTEYLDTSSGNNVLRMKSGLSIEGGKCYVAAAEENFCMKPYSTRNTMARAKDIPGNGPVDLLMKSITAVFKNNTAGLILSGSELDGEKGLKAIKRNDGISAVLFSANCLHRQMGENVLRRCQVDKIVDENDATRFITELHDAVRDSVSTA